MPTSRRQKHSVRGIASVSSTPRVRPSTAHPSSPPKPAKLQIRAGKLGTLKASVGPSPKGR